jgi:hypothetical protein
LDLQTEVDVAPLIVREGARVLAWYSNGENVTPFSVELEMDTRKLVYINVYPLIESYTIPKTDSNITLETNLILNLPMGELEDGRVRDISMNGNDGLVYDAKEMQVPTFGMTLDFDGNKSFVEVMNSEKINPSDEITIETWIKPRTPDDGFIIASKKMGYSSLNGYFFLYENGNFHFNFGNGTSFFQNSVGSDNALEADQWYHLAMTYDRHYVKYYLNGIKIGSIRRSEIIAPNDLNLLIGKRQDQAWKLNGSIYEIVMYNKALTESEIKTHAQKFLPFLPILKLDPAYPILGQILGRITQVAGIDLEATTNYNPWVFEGNTAFFKEASLNGSVVIKTPSFTDLKIDELVNATVIVDKQIVPMTPINELYLNGVDDVEIYTQKADLQQGKGFYVKTILTNSTISVSGKNVSINLMTSGGENKEITSPNGVIKIVGSFTMYLRTPSFQVNGETKFKEMYSLFSLYPMMRSLGDDLNIKGLVEFKLTASDVYSFITNLTWNGSFSRIPPILQWNEYNSFMSMLPWLIILVPVLVFSYSYSQKKSRIKFNG